MAPAQTISNLLAAESEGHSFSSALQELPALLFLRCVSQAPGRPSPYPCVSEFCEILLHSTV